MTENEKILKALSLVAAELYIKNEISLAIAGDHIPDYSYHDKQMMKRLTGHFRSYFEGGEYFPGSVAKLTPIRKNKS